MEDRRVADVLVKRLLAGYRAIVSSELHYQIQYQRSCRLQRRHSLWIRRCIYSLWLRL